MTNISLLRPEERLLLLLSHAALEPAEIELARTLADAVSDWRALWEMAQHNRIAPLLRHNMERAGVFELAPADVAARFDEEAERIRLANEARLVVARELVARFAARGIPIVILKGVLFAETIYRLPGYKRMNDIDILIRKEDLDGIHDIYEQMDLFSAAELVGGDPRKQERFSHHAPPFFSRDLKCMIGTHWGLINPLAPYTIDYDAIWSRVVDFDFYGARAQAMAPEDNLHHLCVHLPYYKTGVRELADIYNLIRHHRGRLDWELFIREVRKARSEGLTYHALSLAARLSPSAEALEVIRRLEPDVPWFLHSDTARKTSHLSRLLNSRCVHMSRIEKAYGDLRNTKRPAEMWAAYGRIWYHLLAPPAADVARMNALDPADQLGVTLARPVAPLRIFKVFQFELGAKIFLAMLLKCTLDVVAQTLRAPFGVETPDLAQFAASLGVTLEQIEQLKDNLE